MYFLTTVIDNAPPYSKYISTYLMSPTLKYYWFIVTSENTGSTIRPDVEDRKWLIKTGHLVSLKKTNFLKYF